MDFYKGRDSDAGRGLHMVEVQSTVLNSVASGFIEFCRTGLHRIQTKQIFRASGGFLRGSDYKCRQLHYLQKCSVRSCIGPIRAGDQLWDHVILSAVYYKSCEKIKQIPDLILINIFDQILIAATSGIC